MRIKQYLKRARPATVWFASVSQATDSFALARQGMDKAVFESWRGVACLGVQCQGSPRCGKVRQWRGLVSFGMACSGWVRHGKAWHGVSCSAPARCDKAGQGTARQGKA